MLIQLHSQAATTPKIRAAIQASDEPVSVLAKPFGVTEQTVYKWHKRESMEDPSAPFPSICGWLKVSSRR